MLTGILFLATAFFAATSVFFTTKKKSTQNDTKVIIFLALTCASFVALLVNEFGLVGGK